LVNGTEGFLINLGMMLAKYAGMLIPLAVVWLWNWEGPVRHHRPTNEAPARQFHLDTCILLTLLFGGFIHVMLSMSDDYYYSMCLSIVCLFAAVVMLVLEVFEFGAPDSARVRLYRVVQCYPKKR
jgi:hypothetical protein